MDDRRRSSRSDLRWLAAALCPAAVLFAAGAWAQDGPPRISALFPAGAKAGDTVSFEAPNGNTLRVEILSVE